jgi:hypothetical protein
VYLAAGDVLRVKFYQGFGSTQAVGLANRKDLNYFRGIMVTHVP